MSFLELNVQFHGWTSKMGDLVVLCPRVGDCDYNDPVAVMFQDGTFAPLSECTITTPAGDPVRPDDIDWSYP